MYIYLKISFKTFKSLKRVDNCLLLKIIKLLKSRLFDIFINLRSKHLKFKSYFFRFTKNVRKRDQKFKKEYDRLNPLCCAKHDKKLRAKKAL